MEDENYCDKQQSENSNEHVSRKRNRSPSSSSASSSDEESPDRRSKRSKHVSHVQFEFLSQQVAFLTSLITQKHCESQPQASAPLVTGAVNEPTSFTTELGLRPPPSTSDGADNQQLQLSELSTTLKDPPYPQSNEKHLEKITQLQRFKSSDWYAIRFSEAQKKYVATPGFVELNVNDELRRFNASGSNEDRLYLIERTFAALSNAILTQKDELRTNLQSLVDWSNDKSTTLSSKTLFDKIEEVFGKESNFTKVTDDILQISCGRRADCISMRRDGILKKISEEYHCGALQKIPPSAENLFDGDMLAAYLQKIGGAEKLTACFQPSQQTRPATTASGQRRTYYDSKPKPSTSKQTNENFFRGNSSTSKDKFKGQARSSGNKSSNAKNKQHYSTKGKKSNYHSSNRNHRS